ncbi:hypothetical protein D9615_003978 [Tricholomella constricta]|uniref:Nuclear speckle splicing regulatory protein 1 N-terminal domain-containing protein n=1 Tax=Tricholomella constricta TaxID=117010 RepID=A0A8H5HCG0_9AGAR|nr:hypothetical protein D9615_003978 [Tricholomella constricta]
MMQLEREAEGDEFKDKEIFVTQAYKDQMEQVRKAEEEEKKREGKPTVDFSTSQGSCIFPELRKRQGAKSVGMTHFYRKMLEESEQNHEATVAATQSSRIIGPQGPMPNLTIVKPPDHMPLSDLELAKIAREEGKEVELNDDNQIVDKRDLLTAGLNLAAPNTRRLGMRPSNTQASNTGTETQAHRAVGTAASRKEINERRAREIRQQMDAEEDRLAREKQLAEEEAVRRTVAKRNNETDVQSARERYLQRKRQRLEETSQVPIPS